MSHSAHHIVHAFEALGVSLPRLELGRRSDYTVALAKYLESDGSNCLASWTGSVHSRRESAGR